MEALVVFYSRTGNNRYVAERLARDIGCEAEELRPIGRSYAGLLLSSFLKLGLGNRKPRLDIGAYETVILCGPLWMGRLAWPLHSFAKEYGARVRTLHLVTCCGSDYASGSGKFGYEAIFQKFRAMLGDRPGKEFALPVGLAVEGGERKEANVMEIRLSDENFSGEIFDVYGKIASALKGAGEGRKV